jgi:hypothetical protein
MTDLLKKIISNPSNKAVLEFLKVDTTKEKLYFQNWEKSRSPFDEGGTALFDKFGKNIPIKSKYSLEIHNVIIIIETGEIIAFHTGRYSLFLKCDFDYFGLINSDNYRKGYTFDCISDITEIGDEWAFMDKFEDSESEHLERTYEKKRNANKCNIVQLR